MRRARRGRTAGAVRLPHGFTTLGHVDLVAARPAHEVAKGELLLLRTLEWSEGRLGAYADLHVPDGRALPSGTSGGSRTAASGPVAGSAAPVAAGAPERALFAS
ncbi:hypothetical protein [Streptomyces sp900129855]|uniref:Uncharacterized protein n=1 Tax=Streptomyces sp. 900129855 TaxID=3155129 RepID=A0ABV2ZMS0_9ACTN